MCGYLSLEHKVFTYVEYRAVSGVFQNIDPPRPLSTQRMYPHPASKAGGGNTRRARGGGGNILEDARHWMGLLQYNPSTVQKIRIATSATRSSGAEAKGLLPSSSSYWLTATRPRI